MSPKNHCWYFLVALLSVFPNVNAETDSFVGSYASGSTSVGYNSAIPYVPGEVTFPILSPISGIQKFDSNLGELTDIKISILEVDPIYYDIVGSLGAIKQLPEPEEFSGFAAPIDANVGVFYQGPGGVLINVLTEVASTPLAGCSGSDGESTCGEDPIYATDFFLNGETSLAGSAGLNPFIGTGDIDSLFVGINVQSSAEFILENASANMALYIDIFGSDTNLTLTYEYSPVPLPPTLLLFAPLASMLIRWRRRLHE